MKQLMHHCHEFGPVFDEESKILILGSFPSVKSREQGFYYGHPQNRFWKVMAYIFKQEVPKTLEEKKKLLLQHHIALWDVVESCDIAGSSDSSITNVVVNDLNGILSESSVEAIFANGAKAKSLYEKYTMEQVKRPITGLPSTSPANAASSLERLCQVWADALMPYL